MKLGWRVRLGAPLLVCSFVAGGGALCARPVHAQQDALDWLQRLYHAANKLSYAGTFIYQHGHVTETSRIARLVDASGTQERIEVLDGSPREIVRVGNEIKAYLPASMTIKVERATSERPFLPILPTQVKDLGNYYDIRRAETERIAGFDTQSIVLVPRDRLRYGHKFWADTQSGMLVKAQMYDEVKDVVEQFVFTQLRVGAGNVPRASLVPRFKGTARDWRVEASAATYGAVIDSPWHVRNPPAGFRKLAEMKRTFSGNVVVEHIVLTDGLASVSLFIEAIGAQRANPPPLGHSRQGAIHVYTRKLENHLVTAVGETPAACVEAIANGLELRAGGVAKP